MKRRKAKRIWREGLQPMTAEQYLEHLRADPKEAWRLIADVMRDELEPPKPNAPAKEGWSE